MPEWVLRGDEDLLLQPHGHSDAPTLHHSGTRLRSRAGARHGVMPSTGFFPLSMAFLLHCILLSSALLPGLALRGLPMR